MASFTNFLKLLKKDPVADAKDTFNVQTMLNENWDKIDEAVEKAIHASVAAMGPNSGLEGGDLLIPAESGMIGFLEGETSRVTVFALDFSRFSDNARIGYLSEMAVFGINSLHSGISDNKLTATITVAVNGVAIPGLTHTATMETPHYANIGNVLKTYDAMNIAAVFGRPLKNTDVLTITVDCEMTRALGYDFYVTVDPTPTSVRYLEV